MQSATTKATTIKTKTETKTNTTKLEMKIRQKNRKKAPRLKLSLPYAASSEISAMEDVQSTDKYVRNVVKRYNDGNRIVGKKAKAIIAAVKVYK